MLGGAKEALTAITERVAELYKELVTTTVKFDEVRKFTKESIDEFKRLLERSSDKIDRIERDRIKAETELLGKIQGLEARLNALSESALHEAMGKLASDYVKKRGDFDKTSGSPKRLTNKSRKES